MAATASQAAVPHPREVVADEARQRTPAAVAAILAGLLTVGVSIYVGVVYADLPAVTLAETLAPLVNQGAPPPVSPVVVRLAFVEDNALAVGLGAVLNGLGVLAAGVALGFLVRAARHRKPEIPAFLPAAILVGALILAGANIASQVVNIINAGDLVSSADRSQQAVEDLNSATGLQVLQSVGLFALFVLSFGYIYGSLHAMRVGLLTRFMGVLGIIVGAAPIVGALLPFAGSGFPLVQAFWLVGLGLIYLDRWPGGVPPAWAAGEARPWPTQLELREQRERERLEREGGAPADESAEEPQRDTAPPASEAPGPTQPQAPPPAPHSSSKKKKRKRR